jgi:uncharacterized protein YceH (UPF0502 family)
MATILNEYELRVLGALVEKQIATPDYYPLTINALTNACNQKNHRDPVVSYDEATVARALDGLKEKNLAYVFHGSEARVAKYGHLFPKAFDLNEAEVAIMCVLILRGPQTPGELRARSAHLYSFEQLAEVESLLHGLSSREETLVVKLPRQSGARESRYAHLLAGEINLEEFSVSPKMESAAGHTSVDDDRLTKLEEEINVLRQELVELKEQFAKFRSLFE